MEKKGTFYFFTGLAGAGKTTIGRLFYQELKKRQDNILLFDGDIIRSARQESDYSNEARLESCRRGMGMYKLITDQGFDVISCGIAMFDEVRAWFRTNIENYREIYIKASMETLYLRDQRACIPPAQSRWLGLICPMRNQRIQMS